MTAENPVTGEYAVCPTCAAEPTSPFPADWTLEVVEGFDDDGRLSTLITPHLPDCAQPAATAGPGGQAFRLPGSLVIGLEDDMGVRCSCGLVFMSDAELDRHREEAADALRKVLSATRRAARATYGAPN